MNCSGGLVQPQPYQNRGRGSGDLFLGPFPPVWLYLRLRIPFFIAPKFQEPVEAVLVCGGAGWDINSGGKFWKGEELREGTCS